jgi:hypothetical protein
MGLFKRRRPSAIQLEFLDADSGKPLCRSDSLPEDLPDDFAAPTSVLIQGVEHDVVKAVPAEAVEFRKSGRLRLWVRKRVFVPLNRILFSLPTISDRLPSCGSAPEGAGKDLFTIPGDGWRQLEFVAAGLAAEVDAELAEVRRVHAEARVEWGWSRMHLRKRPARPLEGADLPAAALFRRFRSDARRYDGLALKGEPGRVEDGFALETGGLLTLFGRLSGDRVRELCLHRSRAGAADADALADLAAGHGLHLVDWCRAERVVATAAELRRWLGS